MSSIVYYLTLLCIMCAGLKSILNVSHKRMAGSSGLKTGCGVVAQYRFKIDIVDSVCVMMCN